jgi:conjugative relaxase-like TrwC/TraI family protein
MIARIKTMTPSSACRYYTSGRDYEVLAPRWSGKLAKVLEIGDQIVNQACLDRLVTGDSPNGEILVDKTRLHRQQENAIAVGKQPPKERAGEDLILNAPKSISLAILVFNNRDLEFAHQLANARTLQLVEERFARTRITESRQRFSVSTQSLIVAQFDHGTNRLLEPHRHTHNFILNLQQHPHTQRWQTLDNTGLTSAQKWIGQIYRNELAYLAQAMGYGIRVTHADGRWELSGFSSSQLRAFSQRTAEIEAAAGSTATSQQKQFANLMTRAAKPEAISINEIERKWQHQATESRLQPIQPSIEMAQQNERSQQQAMTQLLMWLSQTFDRFDHDSRIRSPCRDQIEQFSLRIPGQFSFQELQQAIDRYCPPLHSGAFSEYVRSTSAAISESESSATNSISTQPGYRSSAIENCNISKRVASERNRSDCFNPTKPAEIADEHDEHTDCDSFYNSSRTDNTSQLEQPSSSGGTASTFTPHSNPSAVRGAKTTPDAPDATNTANGGDADESLCPEEGDRSAYRGDDESSSSAQQPVGTDRSDPANPDLSALDCSRTNRHQEQPELIANPEAVWLENSRLEVER